MVTFKKNEKLFNYGSWNGAVKDNGFTGSGMNRQGCLNFMQKQGFTFISDDGKTSRKSGKRANRKENIFNALLELAGKPDELKIKELEEKKLDLINSVNATLEDLQQVLEINKQIEILENPVVTLENVLDLVERLWEEAKTEEEE